MERYIKISIHTPKKGVTMVRYDPVCGMGNFNPHSQEGSDGTRRKDCGALYRISIHTPKKGVTWKVFKIFLWYNDFNPHSQEGSDGACNPEHPTHWLFQSTLPRREWLWITLNFSICCKISIHTPKKGVTPLNVDWKSISVFQSTLPRREWPP